MKKNQHVVANPRGGWSVRHTGAARATRVFETQKDAIDYARRIARKESSELSTFIAGTAPSKKGTVTATIPSLLGTNGSDCGWTSIEVFF
jgi:Uncharacterized protein conserved in bacteria (DUF2188)